ncbi:hypothetical protein FQN60_007784 [Etheostoma spectabile]|uniref:Uncharacterized protein n=1 Tax=Etheostoma spectabile TaxID=54343 RepID=A0A5J5D116_9PERO|nr:hypothetical protein FQN60_007784 [Etheostoma spectabile]
MANSPSSFPPHPFLPIVCLGSFLHALFSSTSAVKGSPFRMSKPVTFAPPAAGRILRSRGLRTVAARSGAPSDGRHITPDEADGRRLTSGAEALQVPSAAGFTTLTPLFLRISLEGRDASPLCDEMALPAFTFEKRTVLHVTLLQDDDPMVSAPAAEERGLFVGLSYISPSAAGSETSHILSRFRYSVKGLLVDVSTLHGNICRKAEVVFRINESTSGILGFQKLEGIILRNEAFFHCLEDRNHFPAVRILVTCNCSFSREKFVMKFRANKPLAYSFINC